MKNPNSAVQNLNNSYVKREKNTLPSDTLDLDCKFVVTIHNW